ncbi:MlaD family protein [Nocardia bovistercoris]|uniref:MCE family protein n=1 Tax=Nocardia bovistercoris TaxID=2785916 RepID=A0A931IG09_9NOCA|nr:MlaD family protein [Nocardia bovistercoris]MBH0780656.1 MCE family protein [Nocardia bovistercoris]
MSTPSLLWRLAAALCLTVVALTGVFRLIDQPLGGDTATYTAQFTDANGLHAGDDVRMYGLRVGTIDAVTLDEGLARVRFTLTRDRPLFTNSTLAIRYQDLTGFRYLAVGQPDQPQARRDPGVLIPAAQTIPAFDITTLFNGLQPVLAQLSPGEVNQFATNMLAVIQGEGTGFRPALSAIEKLSHHVTDRQGLISALVGNLGEISRHLGGNSGNAVALLANMTALFVTLTDKLTGLVAFANTIPPVLTPLRDMLDTLGLTGQRDRDLDALLRTAFPSPQQGAEIMSRLPGMLQAATAALPTTGPGADLGCSHGTVEVPAALQVFIAGNRITVCHS